MGEAEQGYFNKEAKPDFGLYVGIFFGIASIFFFVLQSNGVEVNWFISAAIYLFCTIAVVWTTLRHALPGKGSLRYLVAAGLAVLCIGLGSSGTFKQYRKEHPKESPVATPKPTVVPSTPPPTTDLAGITGGQSTP